jgi:putative endonuclease
MPTPPDAYVYILASSFKKLYIGVTTDLMQRITDHRSKINPESHTAKYNINKLV